MSGILREYEGLLGGSGIVRERDRNELFILLLRIINETGRREL